MRGVFLILGLMITTVHSMDYTAVFTEPPTNLPSNCSTDAPLLGNGDFLAALGGAPEKLQFYLSKADLWELSPHGGRPWPLARLRLEFPDMTGASYRVTQDLRRAITTGVFEKNGVTLTVKSAVAATDNILWVQLSVAGGQMDGKAVLLCADGKPAEENGGVQVVERRYNENVHRVTGAACAFASPGSFVLKPGTPVVLRVAACGLANRPDYRDDALARAAQVYDLRDLRRDHEAWWEDFWSKSFIEIPDKKLEQRYYLSHYCMAGCSRLRHFPPGLYGWTLSEKIPRWSGAYFNNYNLYAPFYGLYAANHIEQAIPCTDAVIDAIELARAWCRDEAKYEKRCKNSLLLKMEHGLLMPVSVAPYGTPGAPTTWGQRSSAAYACVPLASTWYATYDIDFAGRAYPYVRDTAIFWEHYLVLENGRYVDRYDAVHENSGRDINPIHTLALIRQVMDLALDISAALGVDSDHHAKWRDIRERLSDYPTCTVMDIPEEFRPEDKSLWKLPIFRYTEEGTPWWKDNTLGIQHIFPGNGIGLGVRPELLQRARNQIKVMSRWIDFNGCNSFYPAAARVGYNPQEILKNLRHWVDTASPNGMRADNPHGTEQFSVVPCTIQEMLFQSYDGTLRFFPNWPKNQDARFGTLRARGAFLVSAALKNGTVTDVKILSEKGRDCVVQNPWPGRKVKLVGRETLTGDQLEFKTRQGEIIELTPEKERLKRADSFPGIHFDFHAGK